MSESLNNKELVVAGNEFARHMSSALSGNGSSITKTALKNPANGRADLLFPTITLRDGKCSPFLGINNFT
ncbi:hypothetical protein [Kosakonia cowanii]|uniref:hypothetical protein n=1 Tax=Kosakonia cowanii TaxID=208223 RepID=UPI003B20D37A